MWASCLVCLLQIALLVDFAAIIPDVLRKSGDETLRSDDNQPNQSDHLRPEYRDHPLERMADHEVSDAGFRDILSLVRTDGG